MACHVEIHLSVAYLFLCEKSKRKKCLNCSLPYPKTDSQHTAELVAYCTKFVIFLFVFGLLVPKLPEIVSCAQLLSPQNTGSQKHTFYICNERISFW